jgi:hypothetical protein
VIVDVGVLRLPMCPLAQDHAVSMVVGDVVVLVVVHHSRMQVRLGVVLTARIALFNHPESPSASMSSVPDAVSAYVATGTERSDTTRHSRVTGRRLLSREATIGDLLEGRRLVFEGDRCVAAEPLRAGERGRADEVDGAVARRMPAS